MRGLAFMAATALLLTGCITQHDWEAPLPTAAASFEKLATEICFPFVIDGKAEADLVRSKRLRRHRGTPSFYVQGTGPYYTSDNPGIDKLVLTQNKKTGKRSCHVALKGVDPEAIGSSMPGVLGGRAMTWTLNPKPSPDFVREKVWCGNHTYLVRFGSLANNPQQRASLAVHELQC